MFRDLRADEIECRIGMVSKQGKGVSLLLFKDARCDARILDETVGPTNWENEFYECKGTLFCRVGIRCKDEDGGETFTKMVWKSDAGAPSNMEAQKGEASDAFKRACFKWGLGRELYTAPFIWVNADKCNIQQGSKGFQCFDRFHVEKIRITDGRITGIRITNDTKGVVAYSWKED